MEISAADLKILIMFGLFISSIIVVSFFFNYYLFAIATLSVMVLILLTPHFYGAPWFPGEHTIVKKMVDMANIADGDVVYDLGSGDSRILIEAAKRKKGVKLIGVEINPFAVVISKILLKARGLEDKIELKRQNLFKTDLKDADVIFAFLSQKANNKLEKKLKREVKKGARIVSHLWKFKNMRLVKTDEKLKVYSYRA